MTRRLPTLLVLVGVVFAATATLDARPAGACVVLAVCGADEDGDGRKDPPISAGGVVGGMVEDVAEEGAEAIAGWWIDAALWMAGEMMGLMADVGAVDINADWFAHHYARVMALAASVAVLVGLIATISAVMRGDVAELGQIAWRLPISLFVAQLAVPVIGIGLAITDEMTLWLAGGMMADTEVALTNLTGGLQNYSALGAPPLIAGVAAFAILVAALLGVAWLLFRAVAIYLVAIFLPLVFVLGINRNTRGMQRKMTRLLVALITSQPVLLVALGLGMSAFASGTAGSFHDVVIGTMTLGVGVVCPAVFLRAFPATMAAQRPMTQYRRGAGRARSGVQRAVNSVRSRQTSGGPAPTFSPSRRPPPPPAPSPTSTVSPSTRRAPTTVFSHSRSRPRRSRP